MINRVLLQGYVGDEPEIRSFEGGSKMARLRVATTEQIYIRKSNETRPHTEWHTVICWNELAQVVDEQVHKGTLISIEGALRSREWLKDSVKRTIVEISANKLRIISQPKRATEVTQSAPKTPEIVAPETDIDNLPF